MEPVDEVAEGIERDVLAQSHRHREPTRPLRPSSAYFVIDEPEDRAVHEMECKSRRPPSTPTDSDLPEHSHVGVVATEYPLVKRFLNRPDSRPSGPRERTPQPGAPPPRGSPTLYRRHATATRREHTPIHPTTTRSMVCARMIGSQLVETSKRKPQLGDALSPSHLARAAPIRPHVNLRPARPETGPVAITNVEGWEWAHGLLEAALVVLRLARSSQQGLGGPFDVGLLGRFPCLDGAA